ncbi:MAG: thioredoxin domain-containing protein, partial [Bacteroidales bacterium]
MKKGNLLLVLAFALISLTFCNNKNVEANMQEETEQAVNTAIKNDQMLPIEKPKKMKENLSGEIILLNDEEFVSMITDIDNPKGFQYKGKTPCIVDFYADWCRPCIALSPILADIAKEY